MQQSGIHAGKQQSGQVQYVLQACFSCLLEVAMGQ